MWSVAPSFEPFLLTLYPKTNIERSGEMESAFSEVIGQQDVIRRLVQTAREDRVPQALLFCGAPGVGKLALAMGFAAYLLSEGTPSLPVTAPNAPGDVAAVGAPRPPFHIPHHQESWIFERLQARQRRLCETLA